MKTFYTPDSNGRNQWWTYVLTILLVLSGIAGFGQLPRQIALKNKGVSDADMGHLTIGDMEGLFTRNELFCFNLCPFIVGFIMLIIAFRFIHHRSPITFFTQRKQFDLKRFFVSFVLYGIMLGILFYAAWLSDPESLVWNFEPASFCWLLVICIFLVPIQTGFEELLFRGYLSQLVGRGTSKGILIVLFNALFFALLHGLNPEVEKLGWFALLFYALSGAFASLLTVMDDGIELSWGFHTINNFVGILLVTNKWQAFQTDALFLDTSKPAIGAGMLITLFICYPLMVVLLAKIYKWTGWKQRLLGD